MKDPKDYGTAEIARQFQVVPKLSGLHSYHMKVMDEVMIDQMLLRDEITVNQHSTLEGFMRRLHKMGFVGVRSPSYESPVHADPSIVADKRAASVRGMVKIFRRLDERIGSNHRKALVSLCLQDIKWPGDMQELHTCIRALEDVIAGR